MYRQTTITSLLLVIITIIFQTGLYADHHNSADDPHSETTQNQNDTHDHGEAHEHGDDHDAATEGHDDGHHGEEGEKSINAQVSEMIMHHIADANEFHIATFGPDKHIAIPLPVILYNMRDSKWTFGLSSMFDHGHKEVDGFTMHHGVVEHKELAKLTALNYGTPTFIDFSITKNVFSMIFIAIVMCLIFFSVAGAYKKRKGQAPKGLQSFFEPLILFVRDEILEPNLGKKSMKFLPYIMTVFFFIWFLNMLGLIPIFPGSANVTGNIAITFVLALITMILINFNGNKHYWEHIFWMPGAPIPLKFLLAVVEVIGIIAKPFSLMIRLFANITAGHIIVLSLVSLIFVFGKMGESLSGAAVGAVIGILFALLIGLIELLVAFLQAFIFAILSAVFIGMAVEEHDDHH